MACIQPGNISAFASQELAIFSIEDTDSYERKIFGTCVCDLTSKGRPKCGINPCSVEHFQLGLLGIDGKHHIIAGIVDIVRKACRNSAGNKNLTAKGNRVTSGNWRNESTVRIQNGTILVFHRKIQRNQIKILILVCVCDGEGIVDIIVVTGTFYSVIIEIVDAKFFGKAFANA